MKKKIWKDKNTNDDWKKENLDVLLSRMSGWQLSSFKESYDNKIKNGLSLFKKNEIEQLES
jgi:hypothetical protein